MARLWRNPKIKMGILIAGAALALVLLIVIMYYAICYRGPAKMDFDVRPKLLSSLPLAHPHHSIHTPHSLHPRAIRFAPCPTATPLNSQGRTSTCMERAYLKARTRGS